MARSFLTTFFGLKVVFDDGMDNKLMDKIKGVFLGDLFYK
jgi:hypothetical protein